jgi:outer membrane protein insertion porin family
LRKLRSLLPLWGFAVGTLCGLLFVATKQIIRHELVGILQKEVRASCACEFVYDEIQISLSSLQAVAINPRVERAGVPKLRFKRLEADFSLERLTDNLVLLEELRLYDGSATGVGPSSETFRFIDQLAAPIPPERDYPGRWKLKLQKLVMFSSSFEEEVGSFAVTGAGVTLKLTRTPDDQFTLVPRISRIEVSRDAEFLTRISRVGGELYLHDDYIELRKLDFRLGESLGSASARLGNPPESPLTGTISQTVRNTDIKIPPWLSFQLSHHAQIAGTVDAPSVTGTLQSVPDTSVQLSPAAAIDGVPPLTLDSEYSLIPVESGTRYQIGRLKLAGAGFGLDVRDPISLEADGSLRGSAVLRAASFAVGRTALTDTELTVTVGGTADSPKLSYVGKVRETTVAAVTLPLLAITGSASQRAVTLVATSGEGPEPALSARATLDLVTSPGQILLTDTELKIRNLPSEAVGIRTPLILSGTVTLSGPAEPALLNGDLSLLVRSQIADDFELRGSGSLKAGTLTLSAANDSKSIVAESQIALVAGGRSRGTVTLDQFSLVELDPTLDCNRFSGALELSRQDEIGTGSGVLTISEVEVGCAPYSITLQQPARIPIVGGDLALPELPFQGSGSALSISGAVRRLSELDLTVLGSFELSALAGVVPRFDDVRGLATASVQITGSLGDPRIEGSATLSKGALELEAQQISLTDLSGDLSLLNGVLQVDSLTGNLNGGTISIQGTLPLAQLTQANATLQVENVVMDPLPGVTAGISGLLKLQPQSSGRLQVGGLIEIENGAFERSFDLFSILQSAAARLVRPERLTGGRGGPAMVDLDLSIQAPGSIFVATNLIATELTADLKVKGDSSSPIISGDLRALGGWVRINDRRFDITNGEVRFLSDRPIPELYLLAESSVFSRQGESVLVLLEGSGPVTSPRLVFSSDGGLNQQQILNLLARSGNLAEQTLLAASTRPTRTSFPFQPGGDFDLARFIRSLATLDTLTVQPAISRERGTLEPMLVAEKRLSERLTLVGETPLTAAATEARAQLALALTSKLVASASLETLASKKNPALGVDLRYEVLGRELKERKIVVTNPGYLTPERILNVLRITSRSLIRTQDLPRLERQIQRYLRQRGYFDATVTMSCGDESCSVLTVNAEEQVRVRINDVQVRGAVRSEEIVKKALARTPPGRFAMESTAERSKQVILVALRNEGFIAARIESRYERQSSSARATLLLEVTEGQPVSFTFQGNRLFSDRDFLETINLFSRKQPFGVNTVNILVENIERLYRQRGYLGVTVVVTAREDTAESRKVYLITIDEGAVVPVSGVSFVLDGALSEDSFESLIGVSSEVDLRSLRSPRFAIAEEYDAHATVITTLLRVEGFHDVAVQPELDFDDETGTVAIRYQIRLGPQTLLPSIQIDGWPEKLAQPVRPSFPTSPSKAESYRTLLRAALFDGGYHQATISEVGGSSEQLMIDAGPRTKISAITFSGTTQDEQFLRRQVGIQPGAVWSAERLGRARQALLELGLYERIELKAEDGELNGPTETLQVVVEERPLRTLHLGGGGNSEYGLHLFGEYIDRKIFHDGRTITFRGDAYYDSVTTEISQGVAALQYAHPSIGGSKFRLTEDLRFQRLDQSSQEFDVERIVLGTTLFRAYPSELTHNFGHTLQFERLFNVSPDAQIGPFDSGNVRLSAFGGTLNFDRRDEPLNPTSGYAVALDYKLAAEQFGSDANFLSIGLRSSFLYTLSGSLPRWTFAFAARGGIQEPFGGDATIPISERYYSGGRSSVRGFRESSLGPRGADGSVIGGDLLMNGSAELRYRVTDDLSLQGFFDTGSVFLRDRNVSAGDLRQSVGVGVRYLSPIGPLGLDLGFPIDRESGEASYRLHFAVGAQF